MQTNQIEKIRYYRAASKVRAMLAQKGVLLKEGRLQLSAQQLKELILSHRYLRIKTFASTKQTSFLLPQTKNRPLAPKRVLPAPVQWGSLTQVIQGVQTLEQPLSKNRVRGWRLKEFFLAKKELSALKLDTTALKFHDITPFQESGVEGDERKQSQEWQNQLGLKEERQFQITRITNILTD